MVAHLHSSLRVILKTVRVNLSALISALSHFFIHGSTDFSDLNLHFGNVPSNLQVYRACNREESFV